MPSNSDTTQALTLRQAVVGPWELNAYALICPHSGESFLIDPGAEPATLQALLAESKPKGIIVTHSHPDHIGALDHMRQLLKTPVMAHVDAKAVTADIGLQDGKRVSLGVFTLKVHHTPGHTPDQICLSIAGDARCLVGDTIFEGGPGHTGSAAAFQQSLQTLRQVILPWPDATICYPGHGPSFCLGDQRGVIEKFLAKEHGAFFGDAVWEM